MFFHFVFFALLLVVSVEGFFRKSSLAPVRVSQTAMVTPISHSSLIASQLFAKKSKKEEESEYWQGEWICADCGYIYDRDIDGGGLYFEQLQRGFVCPQCSAPRKRYAKRVGEKWGITQDGGDLPIYAFTALGLAATVWFTLVYVPTL